VVAKFQFIDLRQFSANQSVDRPPAAVNWTASTIWLNDQKHRFQMFGPTKIYFIVFGLLTIAGGLMGYLKAGSTASLIAGSISGLLLLVAAFLLPSHVIVGLAIGGVVSLLLAAQFLPAFFRTGKMMPAGLMSLLSILGVVFTIAAWTRK
jgi:uncharacterized membrane protein (UPF0136 family)